VADKSGIEWTEATWNPVTGCTRVSSGCDNCYAFTLHDQRHVAQAKAARAELVDLNKPVPKGSVAQIAAARATGMPFPLPAQYDRPFSTVQLHPDRLALPLSWRKPRRVFVNSMSDLFHEDVPDGFIDRVFAAMALAPQHTFQVLTKRPERMRAYFAETVNGGQRESHVYTDAEVIHRASRKESDPWHCRWPGWPLPNVWLGVSAENQATAEERIPLLLATPAAVRFVSLEPLLAPIDLRRFIATTGCSFGGTFGSCNCEGRSAGHVPLRRYGLEWVILGGESGAMRRPKGAERALVERCHCRIGGPPSTNGLEPRWWACEDCLRKPDGESSGWRPKAEALGWVRAIRDQCTAAGVPFFFKQWGGPTPKSGGRLLDGRTWDQMPEAKTA